MRMRLFPGRALAFIGAMASALPVLAGPQDAAAPAGVLADRLAWLEDLAGSKGYGLNHTIALDGDLLVVGAPDTTVASRERAGKVDIWRRLGGQWQRIHSLSLLSLGLDLHNGARWGAAVAVSDNRVLVGCAGCINLPHAYLLQFVENELVAWRPVEPSFPGSQGSDSPATDIGAAVAIAGGVVAVGAPGLKFPHGDGSDAFGAIAVGRIDGNSIVWEDSQIGTRNSFLGYALALTRTESGLFDSHALVVAAPFAGAGYVGEAQLHSRAFDGSWTHRQTFVVPDPGPEPQVIAVAIARPRSDAPGFIALGYPARTLDGTLGGSVRIHVREPGEDSYSFNREIQHPLAEYGDRFGEALALHGTRLLVGAPGRRIGADDAAGSAYLFSGWKNNVWNWSLIQALRPHAEGNLSFGRSVASSALDAAIGMPGEGFWGEYADAPGSVAVYRCDRIFAYGHEVPGAADCPLP